jgi:hypothetical protein
MDERLLNFRKEIDATFDKIKALPSAQPERMKGRWIWKGEEGDSRFMCSVCKSKEYVPTCNGVPNIWEFCPNCGAKMEGEEDDER